jgi:DNA invertase Pin-like site-specific DNA recombinase
MPPKVKKPVLVSRHVALCYIRQSFTRDGNDVISPDRQRANIQAICERNDWIPEWYQDAEGHKSGRQEKNRPGWLALKARLGDPDVIALVANDLSRLHRKGWRVGDLLDFIEEHHVRLVLASPNSPVADLSSIQGRMMIQIAAMFDEWYAADISQKAKDSVAYRKGQGKTIGMSPFGAFRNKDGFLEPSRRGAWWMPDGTFVAGEPDQPPDPAAQWRSYYACAERVLTLYVENKHGLELIAYQLNIEGWAFRDRKGKPRPIERDDIRRIVANWPEYGGIARFKAADKTHGKSRRAYEYDLDNIPFREECAVFPLALLKEVARIRKERSIRPPDDGMKTAYYIYPLTEISYCAHCERLALAQNNPQLRSRLGGSGQNDKRRYRHKAGIKCGCTNRSVHRDVYEGDFTRLVKLLTVKPDALGLMTELAIQAQKLSQNGDPNSDPETEKREAIVLCKRRIDAAINLYSEGRISYEEYRRRVEQNESEIAHWEARTTETEKAALELTMCMEAVDKLARLWDMGEDEDRQGMARSLFSYIVYDLDIRRIVFFKLKPWAERFLTLRAALYDNDNGSSTPQKENAPTTQEVEQAMPHRGFEPLFWP